MRTGRLTMARAATNFRSTKKARRLAEEPARLPASLRSWTDSFLSFPAESMALRTRFRDAALGYIFRSALDISGGRVMLGEVGITEVPDEGDSWTFDLTLTVDGEWEDIEKLRWEVLIRLEEWSKEWSPEEQDDYARRIYFGFIPADL